MSEEHSENSDVLNLLTPNEAFDAIQIYDSTVEVVGYVDGIESPRIVGTKQQYKFFKFYLNNGAGKRVQVVVWNDEIDHIEHKIQSNYIIHLDGVQARTPKLAQFNNGNVPYELLIRSNSIITNLGKYEPTTLLNSKPVPVVLSEVLNTSEHIIFDAYIKTNFIGIHLNKLNKMIGCGPVTDGIHKLEVHITNFTDDDYSYLDIKKGDKIKITGTMQTAVEPPYLVVNYLDNIQKIEGHMPLATLLKAIQTPKKRKFEGSFSSDQKENKKIA